MNVRSIVAALGLAALAPTALAGQLLVTKSNGSGFTPPEWARTESCAVYTDRVVITHQYGYDGPTAFTLTEERTVTITDGAIQAGVAAASETLQETPNGLCDAPGTFISANLGTDDTSDDVVLYSTGGCGSPEQERQGPFSTVLRDVVNQFCPTTYDYVSP